MKPFVDCKQAPPLVSFDTWSMVKVMSGHFLALGWNMFGFSTNGSVSLLGTWTYKPERVWKIIAYFPMHSHRSAFNSSSPHRLYLVFFCGLRALSYAKSVSLTARPCLNCYGA